MLGRARNYLTGLMHQLGRLSSLTEIAAQAEIARRQQTHPNPMCRYGRYGFSQTDEDGITIEIVRRLGLERGTFCEFGVGDGTENNTLVLLAMGWRGTWIGGEDLAFDPGRSPRLTFRKAWVDQENIAGLYRAACPPQADPDLLSLDLDGNDFHFLQRILAGGARPKIVIAEYNARFPAHVRFVMDYNAENRWRGDDYFGTSLNSLIDLFEAFGYRIVCCNAATGANAFFVREDFAPLFPEVPQDIAAIHASPFYFLPRQIGHRRSVRTIEQIVAAP